MKIVFVTPVSIKSAIGRFACLVVRALVDAGHELTVISGDTEAVINLECHDFGIDIIDWRLAHYDLEPFHQADVIIYQIGDYLPYHEGCLFWLEKFRGIVCMHDFYVANLFSGWFESRVPEAQAILHNFYGAEAVERFYSFTNITDFLEWSAENAPMTEWIAAQATGVVAHSGWGLPRLMEACTGPVAEIPLAYDAPLRKTAVVRTDMAGDDTLRLLTFGRINPNKRVESVIRAIGSRELLRRRIVYTVGGMIEPDVALEYIALARSLGVRLVLTGHLSDDELASAIVSANVISCLRWPTLESASASAIEAMLYGKPILCTDAGFYAELPDKFVSKISVVNEVEEIADALEGYIKKPSARERAGAAAADWASETFSPEGYAASLVSLAEKEMENRPVGRATDYFGALHAQWSGVTAAGIDIGRGEALDIFDSLSSQ